MTDLPAPPQPRTWDPLPDQVNVGIYRFPYAMQEMSTTVDWIVTNSHFLMTHPRVNPDKVGTTPIADTPVDMSRNRAIRMALDSGLHFAVFIDSDMFPDYELKTGSAPGDNPLPFLPHALDFALAHDGPCVIGAPYCCQPPDEEVLVFRWSTRSGDDPEAESVFMRKYTRDEVYGKTGFEEVAALPTGMLLIDMRAVQVLDPPWFSYEFQDAENTSKKSSEDVVFTRNLSLAGVPQYCFWSAWAGHWKTKLVRKPQVPIPLNYVPMPFRKTVWAEFNHQRQRQGK